MSQAPPAGQANMRQALPAGQANMREALHAEWTKLRTAPGTIWLLLALIALTVALGTAVAAAVTCPSGGCNQDPTKLSLTGIGLGQAAIAILAVLAVSGEYSTGMIRITLTAMPRRPTILTGMTLGAGTLAVAGCLLAGRLSCPPTASPPPMATSPCPSPTGRPCAPPPARSSTWP
jgi:ABC-2 type transport system permease protein